MKYIKHPNIKQNTIYEDCFHTQVVDGLSRSGLIIAPTGSGKTVICIRLIAKFCSMKQKIWLIAPTNILVKQHYINLKNCLKDINIVHVSSNESDRFSPATNAHVLVTTPHLFYAMCETVKPDLLIIDETHHVNNSYPYSAVINFKGDKIGFTASPGHTKTKVKQLLKYLNTSDVYIKKEEEDSNVETIIEKIPLNPSVLDAGNLVKQLIHNITSRLYEIDHSMKYISLQTALKIKPQYIVLIAPAIRLKYLHLLLTSHSPILAKKYFDKIDKKLVYTCTTNKIKQLSNKLDACIDTINNKLQCLLKIIEIERLDRHKGIVFASYKETLNLLSQKINNSVMLTGKGGKGGKYRQQFAIEQIKENIVDVVLATSIGEEGLDLPSLDYVIFYDIPSSEKRLIQRKGRTGRNKQQGKVYYLLNMDSPDIFNYQKVLAKKTRMQTIFDENI